MSNIKTYSLSEIEKIKDKDIKVYDYFKVFVNSSAITNLKTEIFFIEINNKIIPCTINNKEYENTYINSLYSAFILYSAEEIKKTNNLFLIYGLKILLSFFALIFKIIKINKVIQINNWLLSTNIIIDLNNSEVNEIKKLLLNKYPDHTYLMRSITKTVNPETYNSLEEKGFEFLPTRKVHIYDGAIKNNNIKNDIRLKNKTKYKLKYLSDIKELTDSDYDRVVELYNQLYIEKHSIYNPKYNKSFIKNLIKNKILEVYVYEKDKRIEAVGGIFSNDEILTLPIVGYNTKIDQKEGLYRLIIIEILLKYQNENKILNLSSGVGKFKVLRGSKPTNEYAAIYLKHLPVYKRLILKSLIKSATFGFKIIDKYQL